MSYLNSISKAKKYSTSPHKILEKCGGVDLMLGSPRRGNASKPCYTMLNPAQVKTLGGGQGVLGVREGPEDAGRGRRLGEILRRPRQVAPDRQPRHGARITYSACSHTARPPLQQHMAAAFPLAFLSSHPYAALYERSRRCVCVCGVRVCCTNRREQLEARRVPVRPDRRGHAHVHHRPHHHLETTTYKESLNGPNISKAQAIANSEEWELTEPDVDPATALDAMPASNVDFAAEPATSASASDAGSSLGLARGHARQACPPRRVGCAGAASHCALSSLLSYASHDSCASPSRSRRAAKRHAQRDRCATCP